MSRIAIFSDIHFGKFSRQTSFSVPGEETQGHGRDAYSLEEGLINLLKEKKPEYIFIAGDLTSVGNPQEFYYCEKKILSIAQKTNIKVENIICVLGNHDIDWNITRLAEQESYAKASGEVKSLVKNKYRLIAANCARQNMEQLGKNYGKEGSAPFSGVVEKEDFVAFMLNSGWCCTHDQEFSHGMLQDAQMNWLKMNATYYKEDERVKIILVHHHPFNYTYPIPGSDISSLEEGPELMQIAVENGIDIIIHGHRHHPRIQTVLINGAKKPITMICAGSLSVDSPYRNNGEIPNTVHFLDIDIMSKSQVVYNYKFTGATGWVPIGESSPETPIDSVMKVGKIFPQDTVKAAIEKYKTCGSMELKWEQLEECLQFMPCKDLNQNFRDVLKGTHTIAGKFPDNVVLLKK
jgi:predicted phosphodiesterase